MTSRLRPPYLVAALVALAVPSVAQAHFTLMSPAAVYEQNAVGDPQKAPPCGDDGSAVATGDITTYQAGETITVTIDETVYHPGHYRIALAVNDPSELPEEPPVTPGTTACGSAPIDPNPQFPVLADGVFEHQSQLDGPQSIDITLPDDISCTNCTLQIIQFMSNHGLNNPGGCYYHHCATIAIEGASADTGNGDDTGPSMTGGASMTGTPPGDDSSSGAGDDALGSTSAPADDDAGSGSGGAMVSTGPGPATDAGFTGEGSGDDKGCGCTTSAGDRGGMLGLFAILLGLGALRRRAALAC